MKLLVTGGLLVLLGAAPVLAQSSVIVEVQAGEDERSEVPVSVRLPAAFEEARTIFMQRLDTGQAVTAQRSAQDPLTISWILRDRLPRGQVRRYRVLASDIPKPVAETVTCEDTGGGLVMAVNRQPVLTYHTQVVMPPAGLDPVYQRSGFMHPVTTPRGRVVTADFPEDHAHQHGVFFAWTKTMFEGRAIDFWNQRAETGDVGHVSVNRMESGPVFAEFAVTLSHYDRSAPGGTKPVLTEEWTVRLHARKDVFVFDLTSQQRCASSSPLTLLEYHYGGMGYRGPVEWLDPAAKSRMLTSEGKGRLEGNHTRPLWAQCTGRLRGEFCGIRIIQHPQNFRYPQPVRLHPTKPYFVFSPEVMGEFSIEPEQTYESRYRYVLFDNELPTHLGEQLVKDYVSPPVVRVVE